MDYLVGADRYLAIVSATRGNIYSKVRLGTRVFNDQMSFREMSFKESKMDMEFSRLTKYAVHHFSNEAKLSQEAKDIIRTPIPNEFRGNYYVYQAALDIVKLSVDGINDKSQVMKEKAIWEKCLSSAINRTGSMLTRKEQSMLFKDFDRIALTVSKLSSIEIFLSDLNHKRVEEFNKQRREDKTSLPRFDKSFASKNIDMVVIGSLKILYIRDKVYILTDIHYNRLINYLSSLRKIVLSNRDLKIKVTPDDLVRDLANLYNNLAKIDCEAIGEASKAARQMLILNLEESDILGNSKRNYTKAIDEKRVNMAGPVYTYFRGCTESRMAAINLSCFYTALPHPDPDLDVMFSKIEGVRDPNKVEDSMRTRYVGLLRRALFVSLRKSGHDVRVISRSPISRGMANALNDVTQPIQKAMSYSAAMWYTISFEKVRTIVAPSDMNVAIASKASSAGILMTTSEEQMAKAYFAGYGNDVPEMLMQPTTVNDAATAILGNKGMRYEKAERRFEKVIDFHERFESNYSGLDIEDIPSEDLEEFLKKTPAASYIVNTEGKYGEVHKAVTRLFYIAEQELKTMTQRVERVAKQITRSQIGVSIVKGYLGRRSDLENFVYSMTGKSEPQRSIAVSFDMSEFSKRFPMALVRDYGQILSELTGDRFLTRIDLFFRASKVMYSNRGYYNDIRGVKGGFEGFLNFIWSSIHAIIMEVALESTGTSGELQTFSDDGLLLFYPPVQTPDYKIEDLVKKIQTTYSKLGLEFHLGKTMVSDHMWEYLGDFCYNNKLIPLWTKEMVKIGRLLMNRGFNAVYDRISAIDAQASAMVVAGGNPITAYLIKRYECKKVLRRIMPENNELLEELMFILPTSSGGLRIRSPYEDSCVTTIDNDAEIYADIMLLEKASRGVYAKVMSYMVSHSRKTEYSLGGFRSIITSTSIFKTDMPDTSGMMVLRELLDKVKGYTRIPKDPITNRLCKEIYHILEDANNIDINSIKMILKTVPGVSEYMNFMGIFKGAGAMKLVDRRHLRAAQRKDTINVRRSINMWSKALTNEVYSVRSDVLELLTDNTYPGLDVNMFRPSPRMILERTLRDDTSVIEVTFKGTSSENTYDAGYKEPILKTPMDPTTLTWNSEATGDTRLKETRRFLSIITMIISAYPDSENTIRSICSLFDVLPPRLIAGNVRGSQRHRGSTVRKTDSRIILPRYHMFYTESRYIHNLNYLMHSDSRMDRTTYKSAAEVIAYFIHTTHFTLKSKQNDLNTRYYFNIDPRAYTSCFKPPLMSDSDRTPVPPLEGNLPRDMSNEYLNSASENKIYEKYLDMLDIATKLKEDNTDEMTNLVVGGMISLTESYLVGLHNMTRSTIITDISLPRMAFLRGYIMRRALIKAALSVLEPMVRTDLSSKLNNYNLDRNMQSLLESRPMEEFLLKIHYIYSLLPPEFKSMVPNIGRESFSMENPEFMNILVANVFDMSLLSPKTMTIFFSKDYKSFEFSGDHKAAYRKVFRETTRAIFSAFHKCNWNERELRRRCPNLSNMPIDEQIDCLKSLYPIIRASKHRGSPYNAKSALIELSKFYHLVSKMCKSAEKLMDQGVYEVDKGYFTNEFKNKEITERESRDILRIVQGPGPDHVENSKRELHQGVLHRADYYARNYMDKGVLPRALDKDLNVRFTEILGMQSAFNETIVQNVVKKIKPYHYGLGKVLRNEFIKTSGNTVPVARIKSSHMGVFGADNFNHFYGEETCDLLINHLDIVKLKNGLLGFRSKDELDGTIWERVDEHFMLVDNPVARELSYLDLRDNERERGYYLFDIVSKNISEAMATYLTLCNNEQSSASIIKHDYHIGLEIGGNKTETREGLYMEEIEEESEDDISEEIEIPESKSAGGLKETEKWYSSDESYRSSEIGRAIDKYLYYDEDDGTVESEEGVKNEDLDPYRVIGVTYCENFDVNPQVDLRVKSELTDVLTELVDNLTVAGSIMETGSVISSLTHSDRYRQDFRSASFNIAQQSRIFTAGRQVNTDSSILQAAVDIAKGYDTKSMMVYSYALLICYLKSKNTRAQLLEELDKAYKKTDKASGCLDISMAYRWLRSSDIVASDDINMSAVRRIMKFGIENSRRVRAEITVQPVSYNFRSFKSALTEARMTDDTDNIIDLLFYTNNDADYYPDDIEDHSFSDPEGLLDDLT